MAIDCHGITEVGQQGENEDHFLVAELRRVLVIHQTSLGTEDQKTLLGPSQAQLLAVADGVGGTAGGSLAVRSLLRYALNHLFPWCLRFDPKREQGPPEGDSDLGIERELRRALERCRAELAEVASDDPASTTIAATLTLAVVIWPQAWILNVGNSRAYLANAGRLTPLTRAGGVSESAALGLRWRRPLSDVGAGPDEAAELARVHLSVGDALVLCTDGLTQHVPKAAILDTLTSSSSSKDACEELIARVSLAGGADKVTCVVARFLEPAWRARA